jgi:cellulose synthase operon protein C
VFHSRAPLRESQRRVCGLAQARTVVPILIVAVGAAVYYLTLPMRAEKRLATASLQQLRDATQHDRYNPRPFYHLGVRLLALAQPAPAAEALRRAADLDSDDMKSWMGAAIASAANGNLRDGLGIALTYERRHPGDAACHLTIAQLCGQQGSVRHALDEAMVATRLAPHNADAWRVAAEQQIRLGKLPEAEQELRRAITENRRDWRSQMALGILLSDQGQADGAINCFETATRLESSEALPPLLLGKQLLVRAVSSAQLELAHRVLLQSFQIQANNAEVNHKLGQCEMQLGHPQAARDYLERARSFAPTDRSIVSELISLDMKLHDGAALAQELERQRRLVAYQTKKKRLSDGLDAGQRDLSKLLTLARLCAQNGDIDDADRFYGLYVAAAPGDAIVQQERKALQNGDFDESSMPIIAPDPTVISPDVPPVGTILHDADALLAEGDTADARAAYLSVLSRNAQVAAACEGLGKVMDAIGDREHAFAYYGRAVQLDPRLWHSQLALGTLYGESGRFQEAALHFRAGLAIVPRNAEGWHSFGLAEASHPTVYQDAEDALKQSVVLQPNNVLFVRHLADMQAMRSETDAAEAGYRRALSLAPRDSSTQLAVAAFLIGHRSTAAGLEEANRLLQTAGASTPHNPVIGYWQGRLALQRHDPRRAIGFFLGAAPFLHRKASSELWYNLSRAYAAEGDATRSRSARDQADQTRMRDRRIAITEDQLSDDPRNAILNLRLARLNLAEGDLTEALTEYSRTARLDPGNETVRTELESLEASRRTQ